MCDNNSAKFTTETIEKKFDFIHTNYWKIRATYNVHVYNIYMYMPQLVTCLLVKAFQQFDLISRGEH